MLSRVWAGFDKKLAEYYRVYLPELPGFGASDDGGNELHNTKLFADALCAFVKQKKIEHTPIIAFSLGTVVAVNAAIQNCTDGKLILIGTPVVVESQKLKQVSWLPIWLRRLLCSTTIGRDKILVPVLRDIIGVADRKRDEALLNELRVTDTKSLVDIDVYREVGLSMPKLLKQLNNEVYFIYGAKDKLYQTSKHLIKNPIVIENADHNIFKSQPDKSLEVLRNILQ